MASYIEKYSQEKVNPFQTDYKGMLQGLQIKEAYWKQGVDRVKSAYETATGLTLTGDVAQKRLSSFMQNADKDLQKAMASDLSMSGNAASAIQIYAPLYKDNDMMDNHTLTDYYKKQFSDINGYKTKDDGKYYNYNNEKFVRQAYDDFAKGVDNGIAAKDFKASVRAYTPYVDVGKATLAIRDKCIADKSSMQNQDADPLMLKTDTNNSLTPGKLAGCITASLGDPEKYQLYIDEAVKYHNNTSGLASAWLQVGARDIETKQSDLSAYSRNLSASTKGTPEHEYYTKLVNNTKTTIESLQKNLKAINSGDYSDVQANQDGYLQQLSVHNHISNFSTAFSHADIKREFDPHPGNILKQKQTNDVFNANLKFGMDKEIAAQKFDYDLQLEFAKIHGGRLPTAAEKLGLISGNGIPIDPASASYVTQPNEDGKVSIDGSTIMNDMETQTNQLSTELTAGVSKLENTLNTNASLYPQTKTLLLDLGVSEGKNISFQKASDKEGQVNLMNGVIAAYDKKVIANNKARAAGKPEDPLPYRAADIMALRNYTKVFENVNKTIYQINQAKVLINEEVDRKSKELSDKYLGEAKNRISKTYSMYLEQDGQTGVNPIQINALQAYELETLGKSGFFEKKKVAISKDYPDLLFDQYFYKGMLLHKPGIVPSTTLGSNITKNSIQDLAGSPLEKFNKIGRNSILNQVAGDARINAEQIINITDPDRVKQLEEEARIKLGYQGTARDADWKATKYSIVGVTKDNKVVIDTHSKTVPPNFSNDIQPVYDKTDGLFKFSVRTQFVDNAISYNPHIEHLATSLSLNHGDKQIVVLDDFKKTNPTTNTTKSVRLVATKTGQISEADNKENNTIAGNNILVYSIETLMPDGVTWDINTDETTGSYPDLNTALYYFNTIKGK